jgi:hypothetical protein
VAALTIDELQKLRDDLVGAIAEHPEALLSDEAVDYASILEFVRVSGRTELFKVAFDKANQLEGAERSRAWIDILSAVETEISLASNDSVEETEKGSETAGTNEINNEEHQY